jgi:protein involved in polysaccharide export with SLBB domain
MVEQIVVPGVVIKAAPNNYEFLVDLAKIGQLGCVNSTKDVISPGDKVSVTVYNHPVGEEV